MVKMSEARRSMLLDLLKGPRSGILSYAPNRWLLDQGFISATEGMYGTLLEITEAGRAAVGVLTPPASEASHDRG